MSTIQILACVKITLRASSSRRRIVEMGKNCINFAISCPAEPDENVNKQTNYSD